MRIIDAHQHFWKYNIQKHSWINEEMRLIQKDFLPLDLKLVLEQNLVEACISVQVDQTNEETLFQIDCAKSNSFIKGIVGWVDLMDLNIDITLIDLKKSSSIKGFRHILQGIKKGYMLQPQFIRGLNCLSEFGFTYDLLIYNNQMLEAIELLKEVGNLPIVLDHIAKPNIKNNDILNWSKEIKLLAQYKNLNCKISGLITEADWEKWTPEQIYPYLDVVVDAFGFDRIMFGSDWPVCLVASTYERWLNLLQTYFVKFSATEQEKFFSLNCESFYKLGDQ
jgi:L-fuconolactonase